MRHIDMPVDYHVWDAMLECYKRHMPKLANIMPGWKTVLSMIQNDLIHEFVDKAVYCFETDFDHVLLQLVGTDIVNTL